MENEKYRPASFNWEIYIFRKVGSNYWKYWIFDVEIFTCLIKKEYKNEKYYINFMWNYR